jgi:hypothetical protein
VLLEQVSGRVDFEEYVNKVILGLGLYGKDGVNDSGLEKNTINKGNSKSEEGKHKKKK